MRIVLATDAWEPQMNGVARTLKQTTNNLMKIGHEVRVIQPGLFNSIPCPFSNDVRLGFVPKNYLKTIIEKPCAVHISTEGTIGLAVRNFCIQNKIKFTTAYHTKFPEYFKKYTYTPLWITKLYIKWFHSKSSNVMATTPSMISSLEKMGLKSVKIWSRGVDQELFHPRPKTIKCHRPIGMYVGRISKEKNIEDFLSLKLNIAKIVVGDGPELPKLKRKYPDVTFTGPLFGEELAQMYCNADVFVFPSKSDTFGLVVLEALSSGVPVACYPVEGPGEIIASGNNIGCASWNLEEAVTNTLKNKSTLSCLHFANQKSWTNSTEQFFKNLVPN